MSKKLNINKLNAMCEREIIEEETLKNEVFALLNKHETSSVINAISDFYLEKADSLNDDEDIEYCRDFGFALNSFRKEWCCSE